MNANWTLIYAVTFVPVISLFVLLLQFRFERIRRRELFEQDMLRDVERDRRESLLQGREESALRSEGDASAIRFTFDLGPGLTPQELSRATSDAMFLIERLAFVQDAEHVEVRAVSYRNPLEVVLIVYGVLGAAGLMVAKSHQIVAGIQRARLAWFNGNTQIQAAKTATTGSELEQQNYQIQKVVQQHFLDSLGEEDEDRELALGKLQRASEVLRNIEYRPPNEPPRELGPS